MVLSKNTKFCENWLTLWLSRIFQITSAALSQMNLTWFQQQYRSRQHPSNWYWAHLNIYRRFRKASSIAMRKKWQRTDGIKVSLMHQAGFNDFNPILHWGLLRLQEGLKHQGLKVPTVQWGRCYYYSSLMVWKFYWGAWLWKTVSE